MPVKNLIFSVLLTLLALGHTLSAHAELKPGESQEETSTIQEAGDLSNCGNEAKHRQLPILLLFSDEHCGWCSRVKKEFLEPMARGGHYDDKVLIRKLELKEDGMARDFDGNPIGHEELKKRYKVELLPTIIFIDANGRELTNALVGLSTPDYYGGYLDQRIEAAREALSIKHTDKATPGRQTARNDNNMHTVR